MKTRTTRDIEDVGVAAFVASSIDGQTDRPKWAGTKHDMAHSASARHEHDSYSASVGTTRV
jgi:hypothetical protein